MKFVLPLLFLVGWACAEKPPEHRYHSATVVNDLFPVENGMPSRDVKKEQEFFFKKCDVKYSRPYFTHTEYECNDAR